MSRLANSSYSVEVPGLPADEQPVADADIRRLAEMFEALTDKFQAPFLLELVRVTNDFEHDVNRLLAHERGFSGYRAVRSDVQAYGKTLWTRSRRGEIRFVVLIDANVIGPWGMHNPLCLTTVLHELGHTFLESRHLTRLGEDEYATVADSRERWLDRWASRLLDEFDVDVLVDIFVRQLATKEDGQPWSLRELDEAQGVSWADSLLAGLRTMPETIDENVWQYRTRGMDIDALATEVIPHVNDLLVLLSHTASRYLENEQWDEIVGRIKETDASVRFFKANLDVILEQFGDSRHPLDASIQMLSDAIEGIFRCCGLTFRTVPEGVWIGVDAPSN